MSDFLDDKIKEINDRLKELKPLVDEHARLEKAADALSNTDGAASRRSSTRRRRSGSTRSGAGRGRPRGSGKRAAEAERLVNANPGIAIPELADRMKIKANYLYRVMPTLQEQGKVRKEGKGWHPVSAA
jgi:hypothetical protein